MIYNTIYEIPTVKVRLQ